jgi:hypothetical protein
MWRQFSAGTFYATLNQVWKVKNVRFGPAHFDALFRLKRPAAYETTVQNAKEADKVATDDLEITGSSSTASFFDDKEEERRVWPIGIFGHPSFGEIAHLIPVCPDHASICDDVVVNTYEEFWAAEQKVIHGVKLSGEAGHRIADTGLKHSQFNKIRLGNQQQMFNDDACVLIVPIMSLEDVRTWNGQGYEAIVLAEAGLENGCSIAWVCASIGMSMHPPDIDATVAKHEQVDQARLLLEKVLCGLAQSLVSNNRPDSINPQMANLLTKSRNVLLDNNVGVAVPLKAGNISHLRVRKVIFGPVGDETQHPAPDPLLLAVKAAVNWSKRHGPQLLASGELPDE